MTNLEYWDDRMRRRLVKAEMRGALAIEKTLALYEDALKNINREINQIYEKYSTEIGLDVGELVQILSGTEKAEFLKKIHEKMAKLGFDVKDLYNSKYLSRLTRLEAIKQQIYWEIQALAKKEIAIQTKAYEDIIRDSYQASLVDIREMKLEDTGYSFAKGTGLDLGTFGTLNKGAVKQILRSDWEGRNYVNSATINRDKFAQRVQVIVGSGLARGVSAEKMRRQIREEFGTAKYNTMRLIRTETSYYQNQADYASYVAEGVQYYRFTAVMDGLTSDICRAHNNKVYRVSDAIVGYNFPPLHPNCRSRTVMAFKEDIAKGVAEVPESIKRRNEKDDITSGLFETQMKGLISEGYKREELVDFNELPPKDYDLDFIIEQNKTLEEGIADLLKSGEMEFDKDWIVSKINELDVVDYKIQTEGWFRDCMESRGLGKTTQEACSLYAEDIMRSERGDGKIVASGFVKDVEGAEYGVSWIAEEIRRQGKGQVAKEFMDYDVTPTLYDMTMGGKLEIKQLPSDDEDIEYYDTFWEGKKIGGMEFLRPTDTSPNGLIGMIFLDPEAGRGKGISPRMIKYLFDKYPKMPNISLEVGEKQFQYWEHLGAKLSDKEKELIEKEGWESESGGGRVATLSREDFNKYIERKTPPLKKEDVLPTQEFKPMENKELRKYIEKIYLPEELSLDRFEDPVDLLSFIYEGWSGKCTQEQRELIDALKDMRMVEFLRYTGLKREAEEQYAFTTALRNDKIRRSVFGLGKEYKGVKSFNKMNAWLRSKDPLKNADMTDDDGVPLIKSLKKVDESFAEAKTKVDLQFYRGVQWREDYNESMFKVGNTIRDRGFGYVSLSRDFASGYGSVNPKYGALLKIQAKAGSRIINGWDYGVQSTNESVIDRDSLYKVLKVEKGEQGQTEITLELIQLPKKGIGELSKDVLPAKSAKPVEEQKGVEFTSGTDIKLDKYLNNYLNKEGIRIEETLKPEPLRRTAGTYDATTNTIQLVNRETTERWVDKTRVDTSREFTLLHEIGHTIENLVEDRIPEWLPYLSKDMKPTEEALAIAKKRFEIATLNDYPYMSQKKVNEMYSKMEKRYIDYISRPDEVFAEGWAQYKKTPSQLKRVAPNMYKFYTSVDKMLKEKYG